jgi:hypothetical protein
MAQVAVAINNTALDDLSSVAINIATSGDNTIITAPAFGLWRVFMLFVTAAGPLVVTFKDGSGGTALSGPISLSTGVPLVLPFVSKSWFATKGAFIINLGSAVQLSGVAYYEAG